MMSALDRYSLFLVDMDNTLYPEEEYVFSGFRVVADHLKKWGIDTSAAWTFLHQHFITNGRAKIFDHMLIHFTGKTCPERIQELVSVYRSHKPQIRLYSAVESTMRQLRRQGRIILVTDGLPLMQKQKVAALGLETLVDHIVYCWESNHPKPDPGTLSRMVDHGDSSALFIGDREDHDLRLAQALNIDMLMVYKNEPSQAHTFWKHLPQVKNFEQLSTCCRYQPQTV